MKLSPLLCAHLIACVSVFLPATGQAEIVYDNSQNYSGTYYPPSPPNIEYGDQIVLRGTARNVSEFRFEYFGEFTPTGQETVRVRFYANDGPGDPQYEFSHPPKTLLYESSPLPIHAGFNVLALRGLSVPVTNTFTWTVQWGGLSGSVSNRAGADRRSGLFRRQSLIGTHRCRRRALVLQCRCKA